MALPLYAITLFVSAFILFLVQPMVGKMILPKLGGTPQVWNTCMVFFQMVLLAGYAYTHTISSRLKLRQQLLLHGAMLILPVIVLLLPETLIGPGGEVAVGPAPFNIRSWIPTLGGNPMFSTLRILAIYVGLPFLVVSTSAPLLQKWFVSTGHPAAKDPYFLYGASNFGSMLALIAYPFLIEPFTTLSNWGLTVTNPELGTRLSQPWIWTIGYIVLGVLVLACAALVWAPSGLRTGSAADEPELQGAAVASATSSEASTGVRTGRGPRGPGARPGAGGRGSESDAAAFMLPGEGLTWLRRLRWVLLAAIPSSLMLGVTTFITTDLSPIPLFWLLPLTLYLLSFILVFARWPVIWVEQPHTVMLYTQPIAIVLMLLIGYMNAVDSGYLRPAITCYLIGVFLTTMVCHGELAKDRPSTRYLTEFYLWMSVGGLVGGLFNGLVAPIVFQWGVVEFGIAIFAACLMRPTMREQGLLDEWLGSSMEPAAEQAGPRGKGPRTPQAPAKPAATGASMTQLLDLGLPLGVLVIAAILAISVGRGSEGGIGFGFGVPLLIACVFLARPLRFGLAVGAVMLVHWFVMRDASTIYQSRSFFGHIAVKKEQRGKLPEYMTLIHGHINHGMNFLTPDNKKDIGDPEKDLSRLATTYYHRYGPAGRVMELYNWFPGAQNTYHADARMPASLVGNLMNNVGMTPLPLGELVTLWSEPPYATVGLGTGTMASYGRPFQHVHYYEIDNQIRRLSLPWAEPNENAYFTAPLSKGADGKRVELVSVDVRPADYRPLPGGHERLFFTYLRGAIERGSEVHVYMGDARLRMALPYRNFHSQEKAPVPPGGPQGFYHMMVVDAFSSDAIPAHLITLEAIEMYFEHLSEEGVLCIHTSNRFVDLPKVVAAVAVKKGYGYLRGHDQAPQEGDVGHFTSEWVMVTRKREYLSRLENDPFLEQYKDELTRAAQRQSQKYSPGEAYWGSVQTGSQYLWTDDYTNLWAVIRPWRR